MTREMSPLRRWFDRTGAGARVKQGGGRWVVVDTETAGLDPQRDALLAIGGVAVDAAGINPADSFEIVLRNEPSGSTQSVTIHGIGHEAQRAGVPAAEALGAYLAWAGDAPAVGFHADFDRVVLARALAAAGLPPDRRRWLDLAPLAAALAAHAKPRGGESLDDWLAAYGIGCVARHNAAADACATAELLLRLRADAARQGAHDFDGLARVARQQRWLGVRH
jgi:DNA polymerase-3 subunit epsilon